MPAPSFETPLEWAQYYRKQEWWPIPVGYRSKQPQGFNETPWVKLRLTDEELSRAFTSKRTNIGVILGVASNHLVDIDLDVREAAVLARTMLDKTKRFGRKSNPGSHYLYYCKDARTRTWFDPVPTPERDSNNNPILDDQKLPKMAKQMLLELRSTGGQTVFPGSFHVKGELIEFEDDDIPVKEIHEGALVDRCNRIAAYALLARVWPNVGSRDELASSLSGWLLRAGWQVSECYELIHVVATLAKDKDIHERVLKPEYMKRRMDTEEGRNYGWNKFSQIIGQERADKLKEWFGLGSPRLSENEALENVNNRFFWCESELTIMQETINGEGYKILKPATPTQFEEEYMNKPRVVILDPRNAKPTAVTQATVWRMSPEKRTYSRIDFCPQGASKDVYNLWRGWAVPPMIGRWNLRRQHILEALANGNEDHCRYILAWMADCVQNLDSKPGVALVFRGEQGTGKSFFATAFGRIFGPHFKHITNSTQLTSNFNWHLRDSLLTFVDEAFWARDKKARGVLFSMITEEELQYEQKGRDQTTGRNYARLIFASNHDFVVPADGDARRFAIFDVSNKFKGDYKFFEALREEDDQGGLSGMLYDLLKWDLSSFNLRQVPSTQARADHRAEALSIPEKIIYVALMYGKVSAQNPWPVKKELIIPLVEFAQGYLEYGGKIYADTTRGLESGIGIALKKIYGELKKTRVTVNGARANCSILPSLEIAREKFQYWFKDEITWEEVDDSPTETKERPY